MPPAPPEPTVALVAAAVEPDPPDSVEQAARAASTAGPEPNRATHRVRRSLMRGTLAQDAPALNCSRAVEQLRMDP